MTRLRLALATGNLQLPQKQFVIDHTLALHGQLDASVFAYAIDSPEQLPLAAHHLWPHVPMSFDARRRLYPLGEHSMTSSIENHRPDLVHLHFMALGRFAARAAAAQRIPLVCTVHALEPHLMDKSRGPRAANLRAQASAVLDQADLFLPVSRYIHDWLLDLGVEPWRLRTHYLGVDTGFWSSDGRPPGSAAGIPRIVFVGHLTPLKGVIPLLSVSTKLHADMPHELHIVGDGPLRDEVELKAKDLQHVQVHGRLARRDVRQIVGGSTALVLPTRRTSGIADAAPTVLMEAQAMGVPAIAYDVGGTREMVESTPELLVAENDETALADVISMVLSQSEAEHSSLSRRVRAWVHEQRNRDVQAQLTHRFYEELIAAR